MFKNVHQTANFDFWTNCVFTIYVSCFSTLKQQWPNGNYTKSLIQSSATVKSCPHLFCVNRGSDVSAISSFQSWVSVAFDSPPLLSTTSLTAHATPALTNQQVAMTLLLVKSQKKRRGNKKLEKQVLSWGSDSDSALLVTVQLFLYTVSGRLS